MRYLLISLLLLAPLRLHAAASASIDGELFMAAGLTGTNALPSSRTTNATALIQSKTGSGTNAFRVNTVATHTTGDLVEVQNASTNVFTVDFGGNTVAKGSATANSVTSTTSIAGGSLAITANATVGGTFAATGAATLSSTLNAGASTLASAAVTGNETVGGTLGVTGAATLASAAITGNATVGGTLGVTGISTLANTSLLSLTADNATITNATSIGGTLGVTGAATIAGAVASGGALTAPSLAITNNATIGGTLGVTGVATLANAAITTLTSGNSTITNNLTASNVTASVTVTGGTVNSLGDVNSGFGSTNTGIITLFGNGGFSLSLSPPTLTANVNFQGPTAPFSGIVKYTAAGSNIVASAATTGVDYTAPANLAPAFTTLVDGATITGTGSNLNAVQNWYVTLGGNRTLAISGVANGMTGTLIVNQGTGSHTLALPASSLVTGGGAGAITLSTAANAVDVLTWIYNGTNYFWTYGKNFN